MILDFEHKISSHCENGATMNMLRYFNVDVDEPLTFGIGSGLYFGHLPFMKMNYMPVTTFRGLPGLIFARACKNLDIDFKTQKFTNPEKSMQELDRVLDKGIPVGLQVGVFHLTYFPAEYRMHYNMHNMVVYGKENGLYHVSDSVIEKAETISYEDLKRVRFAKGPFAPNGKMYYITNVPDKFDYNKAIKRGISKTIYEMIGIPFPLIGVKGIRYLSKRMRKWPLKLGNLTASRYLGQLILLQEEIGTGGSGYRYIYGAFLKEAAKRFNNPDFDELSKEMGITANKWREFSYLGSRNCKGRGEPENSYDFLADMLLDIAEREEKIFKGLKKAIHK